MNSIDVHDLCILIPVFASDAVYRLLEDNTSVAVIQLFVVDAAARVTKDYGHESRLQKRLQFTYAHKIAGPYIYFVARGWNGQRASGLRIYSRYSMHACGFR